jgi:hypothetical protein
MHDVLEFKKCAWPAVDEEERNCSFWPDARGLVDEMHRKVFNRRRIVVPF